MMKLAPTSSEYSEWSFFDDDCTGLQATRVYHGMPTGEYSSKVDNRLLLFAGGRACFVVSSNCWFPMVANPAYQRRHHPGR